MSRFNADAYNKLFPRTEPVQPVETVVPSFTPTQDKLEGQDPDQTTPEAPDQADLTQEAPDQVTEVEADGDGQPD